MHINGLEFVFTALAHMEAGVCPACRRQLCSPRTHQFTCSADCHRIWIDSIVAEVGETRVVTDAVTGVSYRVPTRHILERGISRRQLAQFPRVQ